jgi:hypothetical protein
MGWRRHDVESWIRLIAAWILGLVVLAGLVAYVLGRLDGFYDEVRRSFR